MKGHRLGGLTPASPLGWWAQEGQGSGISGLAVGKGGTSRAPPAEQLIWKWRPARSGPGMILVQLLPDRGNQLPIMASPGRIPGLD